MPALAETIDRPNTTKTSTSLVFIGIQPYTSNQPLLGIQSHKSSIFHKFPVRYQECMEQASGMQ